MWRSAQAGTAPTARGFSTRRPDQQARERSRAAVLTMPSLLLVVDRHRLRDERPELPRHSRMRRDQVQWPCSHPNEGVMISDAPQVCE